MFSASAHGGTYAKFARRILIFTWELNRSSANMVRRTRNTKRAEDTNESVEEINEGGKLEKGDAGQVEQARGTRNRKVKTQISHSPDGNIPLTAPDENPNNPDNIFQPKKQPPKSKKSPIKVEYETAKRRPAQASADSNEPPCKEIKWEPENWSILLENIRKMRESRDAPVDSMGCDQCKDEEAVPEVKRFHALISLMLSSQTKDQVTHAAMMRLREHGLTIENVLKTDDQVLEDLIHPVGFKKTKVKYIKRTSEILRDQYNGDIPDTVEKLCSLPGVGPKMAHLCMMCAWGVVTGIGVDTHVHRIANRLGWVRKTTKTPEDTRKSLESWLPQPLWQEVNHLLVGFGQQTCRPVGPQCHKCLNVSICPFGKTQKKR